MVRTKVFVGNLSFNTKENELAKEFEVAGKVISANIITRGPRSLGYGFVEMDSEQDAENAVKLLNKKEIDGRPINVEVAKPREEGSTSPRQGGNNAQRGSPRGGRGGGRGRGFGGTGGGFRGGNRNMNRRFRRRDGSGSEEEGGEEQQSQRGRGGFRGGRGRGRGNGSPRGQRREERPDTRAPSQTTLFVANLPFGLDDDSFSKVLKDQNLAFKSAHVVKKKSGRSKGFGFVEFDSQGDQQKALAALNNKQVEGRELVVKVALTENKTEGTEKKEEEKKETTTTSAPTTTTTTSSPSPAKPVTPKTEKK